jgi:hypothetical protein
MGNRAVITTPEREVGLYLHWNGGRDSVEAFLRYCDLKGYRAPSSDEYGWARLCQVIGNFFGGTTSVGIGAYSDDGSMDPGDNGIYVIEGWDIVDRIGNDGCEQMVYGLTEMLIDIDKSMPVDEQLGEDFLTADDVPASELKIGDVVYVQGFDGSYDRHEVVGFGEKHMWDPELHKFADVVVPYINHWNDEDWKYNPNNALTGSTYRKSRR